MIVIIIGFVVIFLLFIFVVKMFGDIMVFEII